MCVCVALVPDQASAEKMMRLLRCPLDVCLIHEIAWPQADDQQLSSERLLSSFALARGCGLFWRGHA